MELLFPSLGPFIYFSLLKALYAEIFPFFGLIIFFISSYIVALRFNSFFLGELFSSGSIAINCWEGCLALGDNRIVFLAVPFWMAILFEPVRVALGEPGKVSLSASSDSSTFMKSWT